MIDVWKEGWGVCRGAGTPGRGPEPGNDEVRGNVHLQRNIVHMRNVGSTDLCTFDTKTTPNRYIKGG